MSWPRLPAMQHNSIIAMNLLQEKKCYMYCNMYKKTLHGVDDYCSKIFQKAKKNHVHWVNQGTVACSYCITLTDKKFTKNCLVIFLFSFYR